MKRSISEIGHDDDAAGNKKARMTDLGYMVVTVSPIILNKSEIINI
jgi:hypothetical protein